MHNRQLISARNSAHNFSVKFSPSVCVAVVASLTGDVVRTIATAWLREVLLTGHAHGTADMQ